jgi:hypothetical protein
MPTVLRIEGYRFFFFSNEGQEPPHIHVEKGDAYAKLWLAPVCLASSEGFKRSEMRRIRELTEEHAHAFIQAWQTHLGR